MFQQQKTKFNYSICDHFILRGLPIKTISEHSRAIEKTIGTEDRKRSNAKNVDIKDQISK